MKSSAGTIKRILTFDLMRGWFLVAIIIDHIAFFPNGLEWMSARGGLFVTTAEGFFFISGIMLGIIRGAKLVDAPFRDVAKLLLKRSVQLYITSVVLTLIFTLLTWLFFASNPGVKQGFLASSTPLWEVLWRTLTLDYFYGWADYLRLYAVFIAFSPIVIWLLRRKLWYVVVIISLAVWSTFPAGASYEVQEKMQLVSWQLIFFIGLIVGFHWLDVTKWWRSIGSKWRRGIMAVWMPVAAVTLCYNVLLMFATMGHDVSFFGVHASQQHDLYVNFFDKEQMPLTRFGLFVLWFWMFYALYHYFEAKIIKVLGWLFLPFGQNSLYVYAIHAFCIYAINLLWVSGPFWFNFLVTAGTILLIRLCIHYKFLMNIIPR